jgi:uncharacterized RDD family membrane protein YckC
MHQEGQDPSQLEYVGFWLRVWASIIDMVIIIAITLPLLLAIYGPRYWSGRGWIAGPADFIVSYLLPAIATIVLWRTWQATPGKLAISARIVDADTGLKPSVGQCIGRYLACILATIPLFLGIVWVAFDPRKQGWHDKLANTVVVRKKGGNKESVKFV